MHERIENKLPPKLFSQLVERESEAFALEMCPLDRGDLLEILAPVDGIVTKTARDPHGGMSLSGGWVSPTGADSSSAGTQSHRRERAASRSSHKIDKRSTEDDVKCINRNLLMLRTCGYYYEGISRQEAKEKLRHRKMGTFLLRDSSDPRYLFSLSVKTTRGTTSVRIEYRAGRWRMDCEDRLVGQMPEFPNVVALVDFYIKLSRNDTNNQCVWLESCGRRDTPVKLVTPARSGLVSLQHACRLVINKHTPEDDVKRLDCLPSSLKRYIQEYPYSH